MATLPRRHKPYLDVQDHHAETPSIAGPSQPSKRYSTLSTLSALTADTPSTPPRTPSPSAYRHLEVPVTALAGVRLEADGSKERESRSLRRARSAERTRTWAEEVERQRLKAERRTGARGRTLAEKWAGDEAARTASSEIIHAIVDELNPTHEPLTHLPSAGRIIADISSKTVHFGSSPSGSEGSGEVYFGSPRESTFRPQEMPAKDKRNAAQRARVKETAESKRVRPAIKARTTSHVQPPASPQPVARIPTLPTPPPTSLTSTKQSPLSIDDIIKMHSGAVRGAFTSVTDKAKKEMGLSPTASPVISPGAFPARSSVTTLPQSPHIPGRQSSSPASMASPAMRKSPFLDSPAQSPSPRSSSLALGRQTFSAGTGSRLSVDATRASRARSSSLFKPTESSSASDTDVLNDILAGQALLNRLDSASATSSLQRHDSRAHASTPPSHRPGSSTPSSTRSKRHSLPTQRKEEDDHTMAVYLRSSRLNRILQFPRPYPDRPLQVSLADIGSPTGTPVLFFLGIGCVRHLVALFDDLANALNLRLICIDRWGFGKTTNVPQDKRNPLDWAAVVERTLDELGIDNVRLISHSAGAPYAAATALRLGDRVKGNLHFLAPWINAEVDGGYKWLKWVPNGVIKSAFAAEWKLQSYRLGKPPPLNHRPVSHIADGHDGPTRPASVPLHSNGTARQSATANKSPVGSRTPNVTRRASQLLGARSNTHNTSAITVAAPQAVSTTLKQAPNLPQRSHSDQSVPSHPSFGSSAQTPSASSGLSSMQLKSPDTIDQRDPEGVDFEDERFVADLSEALPSLSSSSLVDKPPTDAALLHALEQASHAECEPGTTDDLLTIILNRPARPLGFSYADLTHPATIWWGSEDERISEKSVRWMERVIPGGAELKIVPEADHNLMRSVPVICEILQSIRNEAMR